MCVWLHPSTDARASTIPACWVALVVVTLCVLDSLCDSSGCVCVEFSALCKWLCRGDRGFVLGSSKMLQHTVVTTWCSLDLLKGFGCFWNYFKRLYFYISFRLPTFPGQTVQSVDSWIKPIVNCSIFSGLFLFSCCSRQCVFVLCALGATVPLKVWKLNLSLWTGWQRHSQV